MITISDRAGLVLLESRKTRGLDQEGKVMRLNEEEGQYGLVVGDPMSTDNIIEHANAPVLAVDKQLEDRLPDSLIDVEDTPRGLRLTIAAVPAS